MNGEWDALKKWNERGVGKLPGHMGIVFTRVSPAEVLGEFTVKPMHMAPNGFLHAGSIVTLADTSCGYGCFASLPQEATGFTTIELKSNHLGTARDGTIVSRATPLTSAGPRRCGTPWSRTGKAERPSRCSAGATGAVPEVGAPAAGGARIPVQLAPVQPPRVLSRPGSSARSSAG